MLTLCMTVKNQAKNMKRCIESVKDIVDQIVVVDMNSIDATVEIADMLGAEVYIYNNNKNEFNTVDALNYAISKAKEEWILVMDSREVLSRSDKATLKTLIGSNDYNIDGYFVQTIKIFEESVDKKVLEGVEVRLFKNNLGYKFINGKNRKIYREDNIKSNIYFADMKLYIYKEREEFSDRERHENMMVIKSLLKQNDKLNLDVEFLRGVIYYNKQIMNEALECFERCLIMREGPNELDESTGVPVEKILELIAKVYFHKKDYEKVYKYSKKALRIDGNLEEAIEIFIESVFILDKFKKQDINLIKNANRYLKERYIVYKTLNSIMKKDIEYYEGILKGLEEGIDSRKLNIIKAFKKIIFEEEIDVISENIVESNIYLIYILEILEILLRSMNYVEFKKALMLFDLINTEEHVLELGKMYYRYGYFNSARETIKKSLKLFNKIDNEALEMLLICKKNLKE